MNNYEVHLSLHCLMVLRKIYQEPGINIIKLENIFGLAIEHYLKQLIDIKFIDDRRNRLPSSDSGTYLGCYVITNAGIAYLNNYDLFEQKSKKDFILKSIVIPICVSLTTSILTLLLVQTLIPMIISWLASGAS